MKTILSIFVLISSWAVGADVPGGLMRTGTAVKPETYELVLSPAIVMAPTGAYLSSELRYQASEEFETGFGFGAGEVGFNFGGHGTWLIFPDTDSQPALGVLGGLFFNRLDLNNYFVVKLAPFLSETVMTTWGTLTPYGGLHISPSFRLGENPGNLVSLRASGGLQFLIKALNGMGLLTEAGLGIANSSHELLIGVTYPLEKM